jgi:transcriptional regulator with XRE-family HTH domain
MKTVGELVDELFKTHRRSDGREHTYQEIAVKLGGAIEPSHISKLRTGKIANPGRDTLLALCRFFEVPPSYFFPELTTPTLTSEEEAKQTEMVLRSTMSGLEELHENIRDTLRKLKGTHEE